MGSSSSSSSDNSTEDNVKSIKPRPTLKDVKSNKLQNHNNTEVNKIKKDSNHIIQPNSYKNHDFHVNNKNDKRNKAKKCKTKLHSDSNAVKIEKNGPILTPGR